MDIDIGNYEIVKIKMIQRLFRKQLNIKKKLQLEIDFLLKLSNKIMSRINSSYSQNIINENEYKKFMDGISSCIDSINKLPSILTVKIINELSKYKIMVSIAEIKLKFINIVQKSGTENVNDILKLLLNLDPTANSLDKKFKGKLNLNDISEADDVKKISTFLKKKKVLI